MKCEAIRVCRFAGAASQRSNSQASVESKIKRLAKIACLLESVFIYDFSARVCNFITANRYLRIGETLIPRRRFPFRNPAFVLFCTCVNSRCNRIFLFPLVFTLCSSCLPVAHCRSCASLPYAFPGSYSVIPRFGIIPS